VELKKDQIGVAIYQVGNSCLWCKFLVTKSLWFNAYGCVVQWESTYS